MLRLSLLATAAVAALLVVAGPGTAASAGKCHHAGQYQGTVDQVALYYSKSSWYGCYTNTGRITHLVSHSGYFGTAVYTHGSHATLLDAPPITIQGPADSQWVTMFNIKTGKKFATHEYDGDLNLEFVDSPFGDPITAVAYLDGHTRVLDAIYDKGFVRLSTKSVKAHSVSVDRGRVVRWTEGSKKYSKKL